MSNNAISMPFTGKLGVVHTLLHNRLHRRDLAYFVDMFYCPKSGATMMFFVNYCTYAKSSLKPVFLEFESKVLDITMAQ